MAQPVDVVSNVGENLRTGIRLGNQLISTSEGLSKTTSLASKVLNLVGQITPLPNALEILKSDLVSFSPLQSFFGMFVQIEWFFSTAVKETWQKVASSVCFFVSNVLSQLRYLEKLEIINCAGLKPILGDIVDLSMIGKAFTITGTALNIWLEVKKLHESKRNLDLSTRKLQKWTDRDENVIKDRASELVRRTLVNATPEHKEFAEGNLETYLKAKREYKIQKWTVIQANAVNQKKKSIISIAYNACSIAMTIIGIIGTIFSIAILGPASVPMIAVSIAISAFGIFKKLYFDVNNFKTVPLPPAIFAMHKENLQEFFPKKITA